MLILSLLKNIPTQNFFSVVIIFKKIIKVCTVIALPFRTWHTIAMNDATPQIELENELQKCRVENKAKSEFLSMVTHQLRTPLSGNKWALQMLLQEDLGPITKEQREVLQKAADSNQNMINLLQEIIRANQNDTWDFQYSIAKTDIRKVLRSNVNEFQEDASSHNIVLVIKETEDEIPLIEIDAEKISFVLQNFLENAIKYSKESGHVIVHLSKEDAHVTITIQDEGIGIPKEQQHLIFDKFFRADNAKEQKKEGTGLGLFTAHKIIERHHGSISFTSQENKGTVFSITLPCTQPEE